ncbi:MAG: type IX secretion system membrane protein PorP/SprF [Flavobacteriales bacterium]|nr:type IX secretion system membrane protein PorP/SprF [Flavobacteriales bacterium]
MKRLSLSLAILLASTTLVKSQQDPQFSQFMYDRLSINPAYAGSKDAICATLIGRQQWSGLSGEPSTALLNVSAPLSSIKSGVGATVYLDEIGPQSTTVGRFSYAYHLKISGSTKLGLGVGLGFVNSSINNDWVAYDYGDEGQFVGIGTGVGDQSINAQNQTATTFDASFGAYLYNPKYYVGISAVHLTEGDLSELNIQVARHLYFMAGYDFELTPMLTLTPQTLVKTDLASTQVDVNATATYNNTFWLGVSYRLEDAIAPMAGYNYQFPDGKSNLRIGYSYDLTTSELNNYSSGSHEIMLGYCYKLQKPLPKRVYKNPRFL